MQTTLSSPPLKTYTRLLNRLGWSLMLFFGLFTVITGVVEGVFAVLPYNEVTRALYGFFSTIGYAAPFFLAGLFFNIMSKKAKGKHDTLPLPARPVKSRIFLPAFFPLLILAGLGINMVAAELNYYFCQLIGFTSDFYAPSYNDTPASVILYMSVAIAPAFAEEYLFRGVIYENLRPFGKWQAVLISAMTFSLMHQNPAQIFYTFVCGIVMALMYESTGSIWCSVFFHLFNNEISVFSEALVYGAYGEGAYYVVLMLEGLLIFLGAVSIVILAIYAVKQKKKKAIAVTQTASIFGVSENEVEERSLEMWDRPLDSRSVGRGIRTPGMLVFIIYSCVTIVLSYLLVLLQNFVYY